MSWGAFVPLHLPQSFLLHVAIWSFAYSALLLSVCVLELRAWTLTQQVYCSSRVSLQMCISPRSHLTSSPHDFISSCHKAFFLPVNSLLFWLWCSEMQLVPAHQGHYRSSPVCALCACSSSGLWRWSAPSRTCWTARRVCRPLLPPRQGRWSSGAARGDTRHRTWSRSTRTTTSPSRTSWRRSTTNPVSPAFGRRFQRRSLVFLGNPKWINIFPPCVGEGLQLLSPVECEGGQCAASGYLKTTCFIHFFVVLLNKKSRYIFCIPLFWV